MSCDIDYDNLEFVFCICEGGIERAMMNLLFNENKLLLKKGTLWDGKLLPKGNRSSVVFQKKYLRGVKFDPSKTLVIRILDNPGSDKFVLSNNKIKVIDFVTPPEIEIIFIIKLGYLNEFNKNGNQKPSEFLADKLKLKTSDVKKKVFFEEHFCEGNIGELIEVLEKVKRRNSKDFKVFDLILKN